MKNDDPTVGGKVLEVSELCMKAPDLVFIPETWRSHLLTVCAYSILTTSRHPWLEGVLVWFRLFLSAFGQPNNPA